MVITELTKVSRSALLRHGITEEFSSSSDGFMGYQNKVRIAFSRPGKKPTIKLVGIIQRYFSGGMPECSLSVVVDGKPDTRRLAWNK